MKFKLDQIKQAIDELVKEYNFNPVQILDIIRMGIKTAFRKDYLG
jgi:hypothetical protein